MSIQGAPLNNSLPTEPDACVLQNHSKSQSYYWHHRETILRNRATRYAEKKQQGFAQIVKGQLRLNEAGKATIGECLSANLRADFITSECRNRDAILKRHQEGQRRVNKESASTPEENPASTNSVVSSIMAVTSSSSQKEKEKLSDKTSLAFWVRRGETLALCMQGLLDRALPPEVTLSNHQLDALQTITDPVVQYIEQLYLCFCFIFKHDEDYHKEDSLIFQARAEEMEALLTQINSCGDAILNIAGYGKEYEHVNSLAAKALTIQLSNLRGGLPGLLSFLSIRNMFC
ncbi:hypothetical protein ARMSODRAFT_983850 [Armillaria solidipes]|uniref:Uncharacterized protein n=1 Tax=Armillaria solidipes TaxID=1076256 RepID=A0A2H3B1F6_9AGAR|nr:hypothetical protein ARMSODRAFT_983850 [Armillaria solidipes]